MRRLVIITGIVVYVLFGISAFIAIASDEPQQVVSVTLSTQSVSETETEYQEIYIVKNSGGRIAVIDGNSGEVLDITDTQVSILPKEDQKKLKKGIRVNSIDDLRNILEDFCS